jgi:hypothetical protein
VQRDRISVDERAQRRPQLAAGRQLVGRPTAVDAGGVAAPNRPVHLGPRRLRRQLDQREQSGGGRVAGAHDQGAAAGEPVPVDAEHVRQRFGDPGGRPSLSQGGQAGAAERVGRAIRPGRVDDRLREQLLLVTVGPPHPDHEWLLVPPGATDLVRPGARHADHLGAGPDVRRDARVPRKRPQVFLDQLAAGR